MEVLSEQTRIHSYYLHHDHHHHRRQQQQQERMTYFNENRLTEDKEGSIDPSSSSSSSSSPITTLESVLASEFPQTFFVTDSPLLPSLSYTSIDFSLDQHEHLNEKSSHLSTHSLVSSMDKSPFNPFGSSFAKRRAAFSLCHPSTMIMPVMVSLDEEPTSSLDYENTYLYSEETSQFDDILSLTSITSNIIREFPSYRQNTSLNSETNIFPSDTDDTSEAVTSAVQPFGDEDEQQQQLDIDDDDDVEDFTGVVHATKYRVIEEHDHEDKQTLSDYDNVYLHHHDLLGTKIRSNENIVSSNISLTSSMQDDQCPLPFTGEQVDKQDHNKQRTDADHCIRLETTMNETSEFSAHERDAADDDDNEEYFQSTRLLDQGEHDGMFSDLSQDSDDFRYSVGASRPSARTEEQQTSTSSSLREKAISITRVRCKKRQTWIREAPAATDEHLTSDSDQFFLSEQHVDGTDATHTCLNTDVQCSRTTTMLHHSYISGNKNKKQNGETPFYDFIPLNHDPRHQHSIKSAAAAIADSTALPLAKTGSPHDKDAPSTTKRTNNFYLIHHQSSLIPVKDLLKENGHSKIEIIQMDEQDCVLEIVDGVLTLVPKDKSSPSASNSEAEKSREHRGRSLDYPTSDHRDSSKREQRSSSIASSISTPPLSDHEQEQEQEQDRDEISSSSSSRLSSNKVETQEPFILRRDIPLKSPPSSHSDQPVDLLDLFSTPLVPLTHSNQETNGRVSKNLLDDSLSSVSSYENQPDAQSNSDSSEREKKLSNAPRRSPSPAKSESKSSSPSLSRKEELRSPTPPFESQDRANPSSVLTELVQPTRKSSSTDDTDLENIVQEDFPIPKAEPPPAAKPLNKARVNDFATLLSSSIRLVQPPTLPNQSTPKTAPVTARPPPSPARSDDQSFSSIPSAPSDREERESFHTVQSNNSEQEQPKKHIDARYNEKLDDRGSIQIKTANIKALFEQKISDTNKVLSQSNEHLLHQTEVRQQQHKKIPVSYDSLRRNLPSPAAVPITQRRQSYQDSSAMNKYSDHLVGAKDVVIEDKQPDNVRPIQHYGANVRRNNTESIVRPAADSSGPSSNGHKSESLIAREIRETKEKEEELKRQRKKCGMPVDANALLTIATNDPIKPSTSTPAEPPVKNSSFLSNLDFFTSKANHPPQDGTSTVSSPRRSTTSIQNLVYDSFGGAPPASTSQPTPTDERKQISNVVSQELNRLNDHGVPIVRTNSTNNLLHRSSSNQNMLPTSTTHNIIQREIEAIRAKEAELRGLGRIQNTSDDHADPRKYQDCVTTLPKSQSANVLSAGKVRRDSGRANGPLTATSNGFLKPKPPTNSSSLSSIRGKFPSPNPTAPIVSSTVKPTDYSKLSSVDRLDLEKRECQEREQELKKQRHSITSAALAVNSVINGDSGNVSQEEHDDDQERYFDKIARLKRTENERAQAPLVRPTKKLDLSQKWEQMMANKNGTGDEEN